MADDGGPRGLGADCMVETAEGPVAMRETPKKGFAVLTRFDDGRLGFRQLLRVEERTDAPLVRIALDNGHHVVVASGHPFYRDGLGPVPAARLRPGDALETAFRYPDGYAPHGVAAPPAGWAIRVVDVTEAGMGPVLFGTVRDTHRMFLTAGVLCAE